jgi:hypothetical protein
MNTLPPITDRELAAIRAMLAQRDRLRSLTNVELVGECLNSYPVSDDILEEMMTRLDPEWFEEKNDDRNHTR